jgi:hypothetical protein
LTVNRGSARARPTLHAHSVRRPPPKERDNPVAWIDRLDDVKEMDDLLYALHHADDPLLVSRLMAELRTWGDLITRAAVVDARTKGATWDDIATALRVSKQAAQKRFGPTADQFRQGLEAGPEARP